MAGGGAGRGLGIAARRAYRGSLGRDIDDPRYADYAKQWGADAPRRMFVFLQQQALGSIPLVFAIFVAARVAVGGLRFRTISAR